MQQLVHVRPAGAAELGSHKRVPPVSAGSGALEFRELVSHYPHVSWVGFAWQDFCEQTQAEFDDMVKDPAAKVTRPHQLALRRLFREHAARRTS